MDAAVVRGSLVSIRVVVRVTGILWVIHVPQGVAGCGRGVDVLLDLPDGIIYVVVVGIIALTLQLLDKGCKDAAQCLIESTYSQAEEQIMTVGLVVQFMKIIVHWVFQKCV